MCWPYLVSRRRGRLSFYPPILQNQPHLVFMSASAQSSEGIAAASAAPADVLAIARQVLHEEADAVRAVADALAATPDFVACVQAILQLKGRVVVTGIG